MPDARRCFQCGHPVSLVLDEVVMRTGWFACQRCGERIVEVKEMRARGDADIEERAKRNLGFYDFKPSRSPEPR